jgi:hypothetical protein
MSSVRLETRDLRASAALMLAAAATAPIWRGAVGFSCPFRRLTGVPCPFCGMTTSVTAAVGGHLGRALAVAPGGVVLVGAALWLVVLARRHPTLVLPTWLPWAGLAASWAWQLARWA